MESLKSEYQKPNQEEQVHSFKFFEEDGSLAGEVKMEYLSRPVRFYFLKWTGVKERQDKGKGYGNQMIKKVEDFSRDKKVPVVLLSIHRAIDFYRKQGWQQYKDTKFFFFGELSDEEMEKIKMFIFSDLKHVGM